VETDTSDYAPILSTFNASSELHPVTVHSQMFSSAELNYDVHDKEILAILGRLCPPNRHCHPPQELGVLFHYEVVNPTTGPMVRIPLPVSPGYTFRPGTLSTNPDTLTRRWDVYLEEGGNNYGQVNPQNFKCIFTNQHLSESLRATSLLSPVLRASTIMDSEKLHADILAHLSSDPVAQKHLGDTSDPRWTQTDEGLLRHDS
jgi:RNase H-like domain found in reverse transcriptase